jgi:uncharacterized membrane protein YbhN (UPF0104 family)
MARPGLRIATLLFLLVAVVAIAVFGVGQWGSLRELWAEAEGYEWSVGPGWLAVAAVLGVASLIGTARTWAWLFERVGGRSGARQAMAAWLGSNLGRYLPGKFWQLTGLAAYLRARGDSGSAGIATSLALQAVVLLTGLAFGIAIAGSALSNVFGPWRLLILIALLLVFAQPRAIRALTRVGGRVLREPAAGEVQVPARALGETAFWMVVLWIVTGLGFWALLRGLIGPASPSPIVATGIYATAYLVGFLVLVAPGGLVVREGMMTGLLVSLADTPVAVAAAIAVVARIWMTLAELIAFGLIASAGAPIITGAVERSGGSKGGKDGGAGSET